jgi:hypothetical protein
MAETAADLKQKLKEKMGASQAPSTDEAPVVKDGFIKGTLIDDKAIAFLQKLATIMFIVTVLGLLWLWLERTVGLSSCDVAGKKLMPCPDAVRNLAFCRAWVPSIYVGFMMFWIKPFLHLGWMGWGFVLVQSINLSGYLFQAIQSVTGVR